MFSFWMLLGWISGAAGLTSTFPYPGGFAQPTQSTTSFQTVEPPRALKPVLPTATTIPSVYDRP